MCKALSAKVPQDSRRAPSFGKGFVKEVAFGWPLKKLYVDIGEGGTSRCCRRDCNDKSRKSSRGCITGALNANLRSKRKSQEVVFTTVL